MPTIVECSLTITVTGRRMDSKNKAAEEWTLIWNTSEDTSIATRLLRSWIEQYIVQMYNINDT